MSYQKRYGDIDYVRITKLGFVLGIGLFVTGVVGDSLVNSFFAQSPEWQAHLFLAMEFLGILTALVVPIVYGVVLPLTE